MGVVKRRPCLQAPYATIPGPTFSLIGWDLTDGTYTLDSALTSSSGNAAPGGVVGGGTGITGASTGGWEGDFEISGSPPSLGIGGSVTFTGDPNGLSDTVTPGTATDPNGKWNYIPQGSAPDAGSTFELLLAAVGAMGVCLRRPLRK